MTTAKYEICGLSEEWREVGGGLFGGKKKFKRYVATANGKIVAVTEEHQYYPVPSGYIGPLGKHGRDFDYSREVGDKLHQQLLSQLMNSGWEVIATNEYGDVTQMRRQIQPLESNSSNTQAVSNIELLQQLASLRDAGILTQQEFEAKKTNILKRM